MPHAASAALVASEPRSDVRAALRRAAAAIAPVWPLESFVAVNPYHGLTDRPFAEVADRLARTAGARTTMPAAFYLDALDRGRMTRADVAAALAARRSTAAPPDEDANTSADALLRHVADDPDAARRPSVEVPTVADVAGGLIGRDWGRLATDRVSAWAAAYFDAGQAAWRSADAAQPPFAAWKAEARIDRTPEVMGLAGFRAAVRALPDDPLDAARYALHRLDVPAAGRDLYLHRLLLRVGGWAAYAARVVWDARLYDEREDDTLVELLAVLLAWEVALLKTLAPRGLDAAWDEAKAALADPRPPGPAPALARLIVLQDAFDRAEQRRLVARFDAHASDIHASDARSDDAGIRRPKRRRGRIRRPKRRRGRIRRPKRRRGRSDAGASDARGDDAGAAGPEVTDAPSGRAPSGRAPSGRAPSEGERPQAQAIFCIDVRSEVFRRHLEAAAPGVETLGFAGFFGFPIAYVPLAHEAGGAQCPVLLTPSHTLREAVPDAAADAEATARRRLTHHVKRAWTSFKMGAISCFSFVGPVGLAYLPKLLTDTLGWTRPVPAPDAEALGDEAARRKGPDLTPATHDGVAVGMPLADRIATAEGALRAMSLTDGFAPFVLIAGHGATTVNNPYDTGLHCGACGGRTGEANARVAAAVLNDPDVRAGLAERGIALPGDTVFLAALHDTTTDAVTLFNREAVPAARAGALAALEQALAEAGRRTRAERANRFALPDGAPVEAAVAQRSRDWAQVRPEWGLAGCAAFIVAPRRRTRGLSLEGRAFLHDYDWRQDDGFGVLELIMTAPMVVTTWINLQYYASTVDNRVFGSGNKTLHNVVGRVGVVEGNAGDLRVGLPWQSVHDGERLQHEPLRLNVVIEAPLDAMNDVLAAHPSVRHLCDHGWLHLWALGDDGRVAFRYDGDLRWAPAAR